MLAGSAGPPEGAGAGSGEELPKPPNENCCEAQPPSCNAARRASVPPSDERRTDMTDPSMLRMHTLRTPDCAQDDKLRSVPPMVPGARGNAIFKLSRSR